MKILFISARVIFFAQIVFYLIINFKLIKRNNDRLKEFYSNTENRQLNWVQFFNISFAATSFASIILAILGRNVFLNSEFLLLIPSSIFSVLLFSIGLLGNKQKTEKTFQNHVPLTHESEKLHITFDSQTAILQGRIIDIFEREMIYKTPDLNIWDLCGRLNTNRTYVSRLINTIYGQNFNQFVNSYRIKHVKVLVESKQKYNNEQLAELSGFGSVNSLYRAFQAIEGVSLSKFRSQKNIHE
jgi:AraC-like DNA-binding protein